MSGYFCLGGLFCPNLPCILVNTLYLQPLLLTSIFHQSPPQELGMSTTDTVASEFCFAILLLNFFIHKSQYTLLKLKLSLIVNLGH